MKEKSKRKIMIGFWVFLGSMWLCTIISKSIYASQLPIVATESVQQKYVEHSVETDGIVIAGDKIPVTVLSGLRVDKVLVQQGDRVEEDDAVLQIDMEDLDDIIADKQDAIDRLRLQIDTLARNEELERQRRELEEQRARDDYNETARRENTLVERAMNDFSEAQSAMNDRSGEESEEELREALQQAAYAEADAKGRRDDAIKEAGRKVEDITAPENEDATLELDRMELAGLQEELARYQAVKDADGVIRTPSGGAVTDLNIDAGSRTSDSAVMLLSDDSVPCRFKAVITGEQKKYIGLNDDVSLKLDGGRAEKMTVDYLAEGAAGYELYVDLPMQTGTPGQTGTLTRAESGDVQMCCVTPAAVYTGNGRDYVYVVKERDGILGREYYAEQVNVRVLDRNDVWVSLDAALDGESRIVSSSTKEIHNGDVVRLSEE